MSPIHAADPTDQKRPLLMIDVSATFATLWLLPRLDQFNLTHPHIDVRLITRDERLDAIGDTDVVIHFGEALTSDPSSFRFLTEHLIIIGGRDYPIGATTLTAEELHQHRLLALDLPMHLDDWSRMLGSSPRVYHSIFSTFTVYLQAVIEGHGIGIGWKQLIEPQLAQGQVRQVSDIESITSRGYTYTMTMRGQRNPHAPTLCRLAPRPGTILVSQKERFCTIGESGNVARFARRSD